MSRRTSVIRLLTTAVVVALALQMWERPTDREAGAVDGVDLWPPVATFSILGYDAETGEVGGA